MASKPTEDEVTRFADMFSAMGTGPRLRIMRVCCSAHPDGMIVSDIVKNSLFPPLPSPTISTN